MTTTLPAAIRLDAREEARRLWTGAREARDRADRDLAPLCACLDLGLRAAEILAGQVLQEVRGRLPGTVALRLELPVPEVEVRRDAIAEPHLLTFTEFLDLASAEDLDCVGPHLHRGWEDRRASCRRARRTAQEALGFTLAPEERDALLRLAAWRNRIFRYPPPVLLEPPRILADLPALDPLVACLLDRTG